MAFPKFPIGNSVNQASVSGAGNVPLTISAASGTDAGDILTATPGTGWTIGSYQWTRDGANISGATASTYTITLADQAATLGCRAVSPVYSALIEIPGSTAAPGQLTIDGLVLTIDGLVLTIV